jgi:hypothetical protein
VGKEKAEHKSDRQTCFKGNRSECEVGAGGGMKIPYFEPIAFFPILIGNVGISF